MSHEPPGILHTVVLLPLPVAVPRVAATDAKGAVAFSDVPSGSIQLIASADGFVTSTMRIEEDRTREVVFTLSRGYRVIVRVALPATAGPQLVLVVNDGNASIDSFLDSESDRRVESTGRLSLGPLAPGAYVIELHGAGGRRRERIRITDRDVYATFR